MPSWNKDYLADDVAMTRNLPSIDLEEVLSINLRFDSPSTILTYLLSLVAWSRGDPTKELEGKKLKNRYIAYHHVRMNVFHNKVADVNNGAVPSEIPRGKGTI